MSFMVNLWFFSLRRTTSVGLKVYAGMNNSASFIAPSVICGRAGASDGSPSFKLKNPSLSRSRTALFGK